MADLELVKYSNNLVLLHGIGKIQLIVAYQPWKGVACLWTSNNNRVELDCT